MTFDEKKGRWRFIPYRKIIAIKNYPGATPLKKGQIFTVSESGTTTLESPGWYLDLHNVGECFKYVTKKSHLPSWF